MFFTIVPLFLNLYALKGINSSAVGIMIYINPIITFLVAIFFYKEQVSSLQLFSYFLILISIIVFITIFFACALIAETVLRLRGDI